VFVLDTSILGILQRERGTDFDNVRRHLEAVDPTSIFVSIVSFHEQAIGWNAYLHRARQSLNLIHGYAMFERLLTDFGRMNVLPFDDAAAATFANLTDQHLRVGTMDLRIAAVALSRGFKVITQNTVDFQRVPGLPCEDWTLPRKSA
jgi:tRNA(fMet)-specific endonuclease VapC